MGRWWLAVACVVLAWGGPGCGFKGQAPNAPQPQQPTQVVKTGSAIVISNRDPNYSKFELPEVEGECVTEVDCSSAGCSAEVCAASKGAIDISTPCVELHPGRAFYCTCFESRCRWQQDPEYTD